MGGEKPIEISFVDKEHAITKGMENWTTIEEELYNNSAETTGYSACAGAGEAGKG